MRVDVLKEMPLCHERHSYRFGLSCARRWGSYEDFAFFLRSAQRCFIISDIRLRDAALM